MYRLLFLFVEICLLRSGPQDVPASSLLFGVTLLFNLLAGALLLMLSREGFAPAMLESAVDIAVLLLSLQVVLSVRKRVPRFQQTATALLGSGALLSVVSLPLLLWLGPVPQAEEPVASPAAVLLVLIAAWSLFVLGHILRHALDLSLGAGVGLALLYLLISYNIMTALFPIG